MCRSARAAVALVTGSPQCPLGWTREYSGHVMAGDRSHVGSTEYLCVDASLGFVAGTQSNDNQNVVFFTEVRCGSLPCPPYVDRKVLTCALCSK